MGNAGLYRKEEEEKEEVEEDDDDKGSDLSKSFKR
jgi:hypothetical protein